MTKSLIEFTSAASNSEQLAQWDQYVESHPEGCIYHLSAWQSIIKKQFGHESFYHISKNESNDINGLLPVVQLKSTLFGNYMVSVPYFNYGGVIANDNKVAINLMQQAGELAKNKSSSHVEFRDTQMYEGNWGLREDKVVMLLDLPAESETLWKDIGTKVRAQVKRPQREPVSSKHGGLDLLDDFYQVFAQNMRDLGTPVYSKKFFKSILETFPNNAHIVCIYHNDKPAAAGFLMGYKNRMEIPWASALREFNKISVNMFLYWEVLKFSIEQGYQQFDFGRSTVNAGTYRFKKQWGAKPKQLYWHYWLAGGQDVPKMNPDNPKYKLVISIWQKLPVWLTKIIGPAIVKSLP